MERKLVLKKVISYVLCLTFLMSFNVLAVQADDLEGSSDVRVWNFGDSKFDDLKTISKYEYVDDMILYANESKTMSINTSEKNINGKVYTRFLAMGGKGNYYEYDENMQDARYRCIGFPVDGKSDIYITAKSADYNSQLNTGSRTLCLNTGSKIYNLSYYEPETQVVHYDGSYSLFLLYGQENISVYEITVVNRENDNSYELNKTWNFDDDQFDIVNQGIMSSEVVVQGLTFLPGTSIGSSPKVLNGVTYNRYINLPGAGSQEESEVFFEVPNDEKITVTAMSSSNEERTLQVIDEFGYVVGEITVDGELKSTSINYTGNTANVYLRSKDSGIRIYGISVESGCDE